ncbi:MAG: hypothetical protein SGPRY_014713, partial [Prymnesium sp.]
MMPRAKRKELPQALSLADFFPARACGEASSSAAAASAPAEPGDELQALDPAPAAAHARRDLSDYGDAADDGGVDDAAADAETRAQGLGAARRAATARKRRKKNGPFRPEWLDDKIVVGLWLVTEPAPHSRLEWERMIQDTPTAQPEYVTCLSCGSTVDIRKAPLDDAPMRSHNGGASASDEADIALLTLIRTVITAAAAVKEDHREDGKSFDAAAILKSSYNTAFLERGLASLKPPPSRQPTLEQAMRNASASLSEQRKENFIPVMVSISLDGARSTLNIIKTWRARVTDLLDSLSIEIGLEYRPMTSPEVFERAKFKKRFEGYPRPFTAVVQKYLGTEVAIHEGEEIFL